MAKIAYEEKTARDRAEIQSALTPKVKAAMNAVFEELGMARDPDHVRRATRSLIHIAAKVALENGCPPDGWVYMMGAAFAKEASTESLDEPILLVEPTHSAKA